MNVSRDRARLNWASIAASYGYALVTAALLGVFLLGMPVQVSDSFGNMLQLRGSLADIVAGQFNQPHFLRPFLWAELKLVFDASGGSYTPWFRGVHAAQIVALVLLFVAYIRPRSWTDAAFVPLGVAALLGIHTFEGAVIEAFPVNTYLTILLCCLAAAHLAFMRPRWWVDVAGAVLFVVAALTVESGLLVWVIIVGAALAGATGVSRPGLAVLTALLVGYFVLRFSVLGTGAPDLLERSSGFGFRVLDPPELIDRFGDAPWVFYIYNVATSAVSVLFAEPRAGVFRLLERLSAGSVPASALITVVATTLATGLIATFVWRRRDAWRARRFERDDQVVALFLMVLVANAAISYPYTKDVIMSPAGVFFAGALFVAARHVLGSWIAAPGVARSMAVAVFCLALGAGWAIREIGVYLNVRAAAFKTRNDWAYEEDRMASQGTVLDPDARRMFQTLQRDALMLGVPPPRLWLAELSIFDVN